MSVSSWPVFLVQTLSESEVAPAEFFKEVRKVLWNISIIWHGFIVLMAILNYFIFSEMEKQKSFLLN